MVVLFGSACLAATIAVGGAALGSNAGWGVGGALLVIEGIVIALDSFGCARAVLDFTQSLTPHGFFTRPISARALGVMLIVVGAGWVVASFAS